MERSDVAIVGAGPVGLTLACLLAQKGVSVEVWEARETPLERSRAIGIHPPALDVFDALGVGEELRNAGVSIHGGQVFYGAKPLGRLALPDAPLTLPQSATEAILEAKLFSLAPGALRRGVAVTELEETPLSHALIVGCDGASGSVREWAGIGRVGGALPDRYLMGDFADDTEFGADAALFFSREGIVESFPLPGGRRRWVARLENNSPGADAAALAALVLARTGRTLPAQTCSWISPFGVQGFIADTFLRGRVALAGDAAHVVSPIGGQGMNLGILGASALARAWNGSAESLALPLAAHLRLAIRVARRAAFNTAMGRPFPPFSPKRALIASVLAIPALSRGFAKVFTMRDL